MSSSPVLALIKKILSRKKGFTKPEVIVGIVLIGILGAVSFYFLYGIYSEGKFNKAKADLYAIAKAANLFATDHKDFPPGAKESIPEGLVEYIDNDSDITKGPWQGSYYDWESWYNTRTEDRTYQVSLRFCRSDQEKECEFPNEHWAKDFDEYSSIYYCIKGTCRSHVSKPADHPGYCVNCPDPIPTND